MKISEDDLRFVNLCFYSKKASPKMPEKINLEATPDERTAPFFMRSQQAIEDLLLTLIESTLKRCPLPSNWEKAFEHDYYASAYQGLEAFLKHAELLYEYVRLEEGLYPIWKFYSRHKKALKRFPMPSKSYSKSKKPALPTETMSVNDHEVAATHAKSHPTQHPRKAHSYTGNGKPPIRINRYSTYPNNYAAFLQAKERIENARTRPQIQRLSLEAENRPSIFSIKGPLTHHFVPNKRSPASPRPGRI